MKAKQMTNELPQELTLFIKSYLISFLLLLNLEPTQMSYLLGAVFVDTLFGLLKSIKLKDQITWDRFIWGMIKKFSILLIPFMIALMGLVFRFDFIYVVQAFIYIIAVNDSISVLVNIASIYTGKRYENVDFIEKAIHFLIDWLTTLANGILSKAEKILQAIKSDKK